MKDSEAREKIVRLETENKEFERRICKLEEKVNQYEIKDNTRRIGDIAKILGFSFNGDGVFDSAIKDPASSILGRLQLQISALISSLDLEETYQDGKLIFRGIKPRR